MISRYTRPEMGRIWSDENKFRTWLEVEVAASETLAEAGLVPKSAAKAIRTKGGAKELGLSVHTILARETPDAYSGMARLFGSRLGTSRMERIR